MPSPSVGVALRDHAWIAGDGCGALVDASGTIDWYCPGGLAEPASFFSLLDTDGGALTIRPTSGAPVVQRYLPDTLIAQTEAVSAQGRVRIDDFVPWPEPSGRLVRLVTALAGPVEVEILVTPADSFSPAEGAFAWSEGVAFGRVVVRAGVSFSALPHGSAARWRATARLAAGERLVVSVDDANDRRHRPLGPELALRLRDDTATAWRFWTARCTYDGAYGEPVRRSLLLLKSLSGTGGSLAGGGTTSVGRVAGGERNRDSRVAWIRQVAGAAAVWRATGYEEEGQAAEEWLREAITAVGVPFPAVTALSGGPPPDPDQLALAGWRRSQPVRVGFEVPRWPDLDLYGDLVAAMSGRPTRTGPGGLSAALAATGRTAPGGSGAGSGGGTTALDFTNAGPLWGAWPALVAGADWVADHWQEPDCGIWGSANPAGPDTPRRAYTTSRVQARFALDRLARLARSVNPLDLDAVGWQQAVHAIDRWLEAHAVTAVGGLGRDEGGGPDGALLRVAWRGPWPSTHPRVVETVNTVLDELGSGPFVYRYSPGTDDGLPGNDNADLEVSGWAVRAVAACQRWEEAHERMERLAELASATGVLSDAVDAATGELLGDLPSAGAHLALVEAALALRAGPR